MKYLSKNSSGIAELLSRRFSEEQLSKRKYRIEQIGISSFIDMFFLPSETMNLKKHVFKIQIIYPTITTMNGILLLKVEKVINYNDYVCQRNEKLLEVTEEDLNTLLNSILLKFDKIHIEKYYEST